MLIYNDFELFCYNHFNIPTEITKNYKEDFISNRFSFFTYLQHFIQYVLNEREQYIFYNFYGFIENAPKATFASIAIRYGITKERVRQLAQHIPPKIYKHLNKINSNFDFSSILERYNIDLKKDIVCFNKKTAQYINAKENLNYSAKLYYMICAGLTVNLYVPVQSFGDNYENYYLANKKHTLFFKFDKFLADLERLAGMHRTADMVYVWENYLNFFLTPGHNDVSMHLKNICAIIASESFGACFAMPDNLVFKRTSQITGTEHVIDILKEKGEPMKLTDIYNALLLRTSKAPVSKESLRASILTNKNIKAIGRASTYCLAEWNWENTDSIKDIVKKYLELSPNALHIEDITNYVNAHRKKTTSKNIISNLRLDKNNTFAFFKLGYIGLSNKQYENIQLNSDQAYSKRKKNKSEQGCNQLLLL